jgi:osmotically-inducible protein OsmY
MANDRNRYDRDRNRDRGMGDREREDDGYIARRGFGNDRSGFERGGRDDRSNEGRGRERDFGDSAGYGSGGSALDWRDVVGDDRNRDDRSRSVFGGDRGQDRGYSRSGREQDRFGSSAFGRGSRDDGDERGFFERAGDEVRSWFGDDDADRGRDRDMRQGEHHRGRGPKGYQRSDERILEDVNDRLTDDPHIDASEIDVSVSNREVTLNGTVNSRFEKRHAEDLAESVSGVGHVQNNLRVQQYADAGMGGSMLSGTGAAGAGSTGTPAGGASPAGTGGARRRTSGTSGA